MVSFDYDNGFDFGSEEKVEDRRKNRKREEA